MSQRREFVTLLCVQQEHDSSSVPPEAYRFGHIRATFWRAL
jgi:hypothetical protein